MGCYCIARKQSQYRHEKTKPQVVLAISCSFEVCSHDLNLIVIGQYTTDMSESSQSVHGFLSFTVIKQTNYIETLINFIHLSHLTHKVASFILSRFFQLNAFFQLNVYNLQYKSEFVLLELSS